MQRVQIQDGASAISVFKGALSGKESDLRTMEVELRQSREKTASFQAIIASLQERVQASHSATSAMKRKKFEVAQQPIAPKLTERTRFGGGFDLTARRDNNLKLQGFRLTEEDVSHIGPRDSGRRKKDQRPVSSRIEDLSCWRANGSTVRSRIATEDITDRRNVEDDRMRKRPRKLAVNIEHRSTPGDQSGQSSSLSSSRSGGSQSGRPQVKVHTKVIRF
jgi:hypothetical protein